MDSAPEVPKKRTKKLPKISKFAAADEPALPTGKSTIEIIKDTETRDLKTAAEDANKELASLTEGINEGIKIDVLSDQSDESKATPELKLTEPDVQSNDSTEQKPSLKIVSDQPVETEQLTNEKEIEDPEPEPEPVVSQPEIEELSEDGIPDDPVTVRAIEAIVAEEADMVLEAEDEEREAAELAKQPRRPKNLLVRLLSYSGVRWGIFILLLLAVIGVGFTPQSRYYLLNAVGIRSTLSLKVIDSGTQLPLKNVAVSAGGSATQTDAEGIARLQNVPLGSTKLIIEKRAFSKVEKNITVGWGSNPLGEFSVRAVGVQYTFIIKDFLSGKPIESAEASSGDGNAVSDNDGKLILTLDTANQEDDDQIEVVMSAEKYREEKVLVTVSNKEVQSVEMVPDRKHSFISKRSGTYDIYSIDIDGKNEQKLVTGTGLERDDIAFVPHQSESIAALVSTRERVTSPSGYLLSTLYIVDTTSGKLTKADQSEKIQIIGWSKAGRLVYVKIASGADGTDPERHRIMSVNSQNIDDTKQLASANAFNDVLMVGDKIYFAPSNAFIEDSSPGVFAILATADDKQTIVADSEVFQLQRTSYETLDINVGSGWYSYSLSGGSQALPSQQPNTQRGKFFTDNFNTNFSLWVDERDGKGVLLAYDRVARKDQELTSRNGLKTPTYWLNEKVVIFRVKDSRETADYVISMDGGEARKITTVTDSLGIDRLYNY